VRIDAFAHVLPPLYRERVLEVLRARGDQVAAEYERMLGFDPTLVDLEDRFRLMDEIGPDYRQVLVMAHTSVEHEAPGTAAELAQVGNQELAGRVAAHPQRFTGWVAQTALQDGERGLAAVERAIAERGALGAQVFTSMQGRSLDHPDYEPFFALMAELDRPIWIHPNRTVQWSDFPLSEPESRYMLYSAARLTRPPLDYLARFYADTANFGNPIALRAALEFFGVDHVLFGTDFGFSRHFAPSTVEDVEAVVQDEAQKRAIYEGNVTRLLRLQGAGARS
jgi:predicted TIM-barrel fold metal-dependent hydrolase